MLPRLLRLAGRRAPSRAKLALGALPSRAKSTEAANWTEAAKSAEKAGTLVNPFFQPSREEEFLEANRSAPASSFPSPPPPDEAAALQSKMASAMPPLDELVKVDVGGSIFRTSRAVLTRVEGSMLSAMFLPGGALTQQKPAADGSVFLDRDPERFRHVLDFLRDLDAPRLLKVLRAMPELEQEAMERELEFYGLEDALFGPPSWTDAAVFRPGPDLVTGRFLTAAVKLRGKIYVFGGYSAEFKNLAEHLDTETMVFRAGPRTDVERAGCCAAALDDDRLLVMGGTCMARGPALNTTEVLYLSTQNTVKGPMLRGGRNHSCAIKLDKDRIMVLGGQDAAVNSLASTEILDVGNMKFFAGPAMTERREGHCAIRIDERRPAPLEARGAHRILVAGGFDWDLRELDSTEILDLRTMKFSPGPKMQSRRNECGGVVVDDNHVLIVGGNDSTMLPTATSELLNLRSMEFQVGPAMQTPRCGCSVVRLDSTAERRIFVIGGRDDYFCETQKTEILSRKAYDAYLHT
ncbi:hypothetical protein M885DRAFT_623227 [Pelagophyceae sp. CCMP2097]|nr:hypothetical protein M885DRAFT_623227 [Pelagophyceae sp. CCMP2097]